MVVWSFHLDGSARRRAGNELKGRPELMLSRGAVAGVVLIGSLVVVSLAASLPVAAADDAAERVWQFSEFNDPDNKGRMTARLVYGVPETDDIQVTGVCDASPSTGVKFSSLTFGADIGATPKNGEQAELRFTGGGFDHAVKGAIYLPPGEEGIAGVLLDVEHDDPLWQALQDKDTLDYLVPGYRASTLSMARGRDKIKSFIAACRTYAEVVLGDDKKTAGAAAAESAGGSAEKDAFAAAKELGTAEAWEAFIASYPSGFHADLARAYIKKLSGAGASPPTNAGTGGVNGLNVTFVEYAGGAFVKNGPDTWVEQKKSGGDALRFNETFRSGQEVKLFDKRRKVHISLNLADGSIWYAPDGKPLTKLYEIVSVRGADTAPPAPISETAADPQALGPVVSSISKAPSTKLIASVPYPAKRSCSERGNLRSQRYDTPAKITFVHYAGNRRDVHWLDYSGRAHNFITIKPGQQVTAETFLTHPWMITDGSGNCLEIVLPRPGTSIVRFGAPATAPAKTVSKKKCRKGYIRLDGKCIRKRDAAGYCGPGYRAQGGKCVQGYRAPPPQAQRPSWQIEAIKKGCAPGMGWNAQEGCHEND
jgi:VHL beta domain